METPPPDDRPIFVFTIHRSGGTALARMLNCVPGIVIWGEHGGFINQLAMLDDMIRHFPGMTSPLAGRHLPIFVRRNKTRPKKFNPWLSPFERDAYRRWCRDFIRTTFTREVPEGHRWGFKEIRYHTPLVARFLHDLFPGARFVLLRRDPVKLCVSNLLAGWTLRASRRNTAGTDEDRMKAAIADCAYAIVAIDHGFTQIAAALGKACLVVDHETLATQPRAVAARLATFVGFDMTPQLSRTIARTMRHRPGKTDTSASQNLLNRETIEALAPRYLDEARATIARDGISLGRLRRYDREGSFSYVLGDHKLRTTPHSSMF